MMPHNHSETESAAALLQQVLANLRELRREYHLDRRELWRALNDIRESITGNGREGLSKQVDRNTNFRSNLSRLLWALFTPLYGGLVVMLLKILLN